MTGQAMTDVRCPNGRDGGSGKLLFRVRRDPDVTIVPGNVIEVRCRECTKARGGPVAHQWSPIGEYLGDVHE